MGRIIRRVIKIEPRRYFLCSYYILDDGGRIIKEACWLFDIVPSRQIVTTKSDERIGRKRRGEERKSRSELYGTDLCHFINLNTNVYVYTYRYR